MPRWFAAALLWLPGCICEPGGGACGGQCVDLGSSRLHCGHCYWSCGTGEICSQGSCVPLPQCNTDADCDDGRVCNGLERCGAGFQCYRATPEVVCDDGIACTRDECVEPSGACSSTPDDALCGASAQCVGAEEAPSGCRSVCPGSAPGECDTVLQCGCPSTQGCYVGATPAACEPAGTGSHGELCDVQCAPGAHCFDVALGTAGPVGVCRANCATDADCPEGALCMWEIGTTSGAPSGTRLCTQACDLATQSGCPAGTGCHPLRPAGTETFLDCTAIGTVGQDGSCTATADCLAGHLCVTFTTGGQRCARFCRYDSNCSGTSRCVGLREPIVVDGVEYGVCD